MILLQIFLAIVPCVAILLTVRAVWKGSDYIAASNFGWSERTLDQVFHRSQHQRRLMKITPLVLMGTFVLAGSSTLHTATHFLGDLGFVDRESGEWTTYRYIFATIVGVPLGLAFCVGYIQLCEKAIPKDIADLDDPCEQLTKLIGPDWKHNN